ncbi:MAG: sacsin N-terminal ATP-binding-like domain-containing protein [Promethearchaeota archaeon]
MSLIREVYEDHLDLARSLKKHPGLKKVYQELYPDRAHFIYELLQNAEDVEATNVSFYLYEDKLTFEHNGLPFNEEDVWGITDFGMGTKTDKATSIGKFGVGFKAVFNYTSTPIIYSPTYSFRIEQSVLPFEIAPPSDLGELTRFVFPFNEPKKKPEVAFKEIEKGLNSLKEITLLFVSNINSIKWNIKNKKEGQLFVKKYSEHLVEIIKNIDGKESKTSLFLKFEKPIKEVNTLKVSIAFEVESIKGINKFDPSKPLSEQIRIRPAEEGKVSVYFPAKKEASKLRFHINGPFEPNLDRASIKETDINDSLINQIAELTVASLHKIKEFGLLDRDFLGVLPNHQDWLYDAYKPILKAIIKEMQNEPLTPTHDKSHEPAKNLLQTKAIIKEMLSKEDLQFLFPDSRTLLNWVVSPTKRNTDVDRFIHDLGINDFNVKDLFKIITNRISDRWEIDCDNEFINWLSMKSPLWHQYLYSLFYDYMQDQSEPFKTFEINKIRYAKIVRTSKGTYLDGEHCYFPKEDSPDDSMLNIVDLEILKSGKRIEFKEKAKGFLHLIGVKEINEEEEIRAILNKRYSYSWKEIDEETHLNDLERFIAFSNRYYNKDDIFHKFCIFKGVDGNMHMPQNIYIDNPYLNTGLQIYFELIGEEEPVLLSEYYFNSQIDVKSLIKFAEKVGVSTMLPIRKKSLKGHPEEKRLRYFYYNAKITKYENEEDWYIPGLEKALANPSLVIAKIIWDRLKEVYYRQFYASYTPNNQYEPITAPSSLVLALKEFAWIPQKDKGFVKPSDALVELLPDGFLFDENYPWIEEIGFGENHKKKELAAEENEEIAELLGLDDEEAIEDIKWFAQLSPEVRKRVKRQINKESQELPESESRNPDIRKKRTAELAAEAPDRITVKQPRSVSLGLSQIKEEAETYLRHQYTNDDELMICQICKAELPFKLKNGEPYFEKVEFIPNLPKRFYQNYLALCPNHAAMFLYANDSDEELQNIFLQLAEEMDNLDPEECQLKVKLAGNDETIYFTKTHLFDLKTIIEEEMKIDEDIEIED